MKDNEIDLLVLSIAANQFTVPLPTGKEVVRAVNSHDQLVAALKYPRFGDTATLLEKMADSLDRQTDAGWTHLYSHHLRNAAQDMREALAQAEKE